MKNLLTAKRGTILVIILSLVFLFSTSVDTLQAQVSVGPKFNAGSRSGGPFVITKSDGTKVNNVDGSPGAYEQNFLRVGTNWRRTGNYPNGGNSLEVCTPGQKIVVWIYMHNTVDTRYNHRSVSNLDFKGSAIAKNARISLTSPHLNQQSYNHTHRLTATLSANNARSVNDIAHITCNQQPIRLLKSSASPQIFSWANEAINRTKHQKAKQVFGGDYVIGQPDQLFTSTGSQVGYKGGNLPGCRYYAVYMKVELTVDVYTPPPPPSPVENPPIIPTPPTTTPTPPVVVTPTLPTPPEPITPYTPKIPVLPPPKTTPPKIHPPNESFPTPPEPKTPTPLPPPPKTPTPTPTPPHAPRTAAIGGQLQPKTIMIVSGITLLATVLYNVFLGRKRIKMK